MLVIREVLCKSSKQFENANISKNLKNDYCNFTINTFISLLFISLFSPPEFKLIL